MSRLIDALLRFTRLDQGTETLLMETIDISQLVTILCHDQQLLAVKGIQLKTDIETGLSLLADRDLLVQLVDNLVRNAYRYGKHKGEILVALKDKDDMIEFLVQDNGIGIAEADLAHIWQSFYRVDQTRHATHPNSFGLGLALVKKIAEVYGAKVEVDSQLEKGSTFRILFPKSS